MNGIYISLCPRALHEFGGSGFVVAFVDGTSRSGGESVNYPLPGQFHGQNNVSIVAIEIEMFTFVVYR